MGTDGSTGLILTILAAVLFFCAVIGGVVWLYSAQSAKRRKVPASSAAEKEKHDVI